MRTSCCFSSRQDREETGGGERKLRRSRRRKTGRDRQTKHRRRAREVGLCARWGSDLNLGLETSPWAVRRPSIGPSTQALRLLFPPKNIPVVIVVVVVVVILERIAHAAHDVQREREREEDIIASALCNVTGGAFLATAFERGDVGRALTEFPEPWKRCYGRKI